jgi:hypothetical protein
METFNTWIRGAVTAAILVVAAWWLVQVSNRLGTAPRTDAEGKIVVDEYQRAKDILLVVLPLVTTAIGYWFGVQGKDAAEKKADEATEAKTAILATSKDPDLLKSARDKYPTAFGLPEKP